MTNDHRLQASRIRSINIERRRGYATPITKHGTLIVNRIGSSCYSSVYDHHLGHMSMAPLRWIYRARQTFARVNRDKSINDNEFHWYPKLLNNLLQMLPIVSRRLTTITERF
jgi:hypothetical protein